MEGGGASPVKGIPLNISNLQMSPESFVLHSLKRDPGYTPALERRVQETLEKGGNTTQYFWTRAALELCHRDDNIADCIETLALVHGLPAQQ